MNQSNYKLKIVIEILILEKILQHLITAYFYLFSNIKPDYGSNFVLDDNILAFFNIIYMILFIISFYVFFANQKYAKYVIIFPNILDILSEYIFHSLGYITVSVIVSTLIIVIFITSSKKWNHLNQNEKISEF